MKFAATWLMALLVSAPRQEEIKEGKTYINRKHNLSFSLPSGDWGTLRCGKDLEWKWAGEVCELISQDRNVAGYLAVEEPPTPVEAAADAFVQFMSKVKDTKSFKEVKKDKAGEALRMEHVWEFRDFTFHCVALIGANPTACWRLFIDIEEKSWASRKEEINKIVESLKPAPAETSDKETPVPNPWKGCGKGSWARFKCASDTAGQKSESEWTYVLIDQNEDSYTIRTDIVCNGVKTEGQPTPVSLKQKFPGIETKTEDTGETLKTPKGEFKCKCVKSTWTGGSSKTWTNESVPSTMVRSESENQVQGVKIVTVMELVDFEKK